MYVRHAIELCVLLLLFIFTVDVVFRMFAMDTTDNNIAAEDGQSL